MVSTNTTDQERAAAAPASPSETLTPPLVSTNTTDREGLAAAPPRTYGLTPAVGAGKTTRQCDAEYSANKVAIGAWGQTKRAFVASCRAVDETNVRGTALSPIDAENGEIAPTNTQTAVEGKGHGQTVQIEKSISVEPATIEQAGGADLLPPTAPQVATNTTDRKRLAAAPAGGAGKMTGQCDAKYAANKAAIKASGQTKRAFVASCQAAVEGKGHDQTVQIEKSISVEPATIEQAVGADLPQRTPPPLPRIQPIGNGRPHPVRRRTGIRPQVVQERRPVSATPNTRRAKLRSKRRDRPNARLSLRATRARGRLCRELPLLPHHPRTLGRPPPRPEPAFPSQEPAAPAQHQCPQITARRRRLPAHANFRANSRPVPPAPRTRSFWVNKLHACHYAVTHNRGNAKWRAYV